MYGYPLDIGIGIDNFGSSQNLWYAFHATKDIALQDWVLASHLETAEHPPDVFLSDCALSLISGCAKTIPLSLHLFCLHHLNGNVTTNLQASLGPEWTNFARDFWAAYCAVSLDNFDHLFDHLCTHYPFTI